MPHVDLIEIIFVLAIVLIILRPARLSDASLSVGRRMGALGQPEPADAGVSEAGARADVGSDRGG